MPTAAPVPAAAAEPSAGAKLTADFDIFLSLLTTQLQYQDPLDPMDSSEYTQQLVSYSQVEQAIQQTQKLDAILAAMSAQDLAGASSLIGREVGIYAADQVAGADGASWVYEVPDGAALTQLRVTDALGQEVYAAAGESAAGRHDLSWSGGEAGQSYTLAVTAFSPGGRPLAARTLVFGRVAGVEALAGDIILDLGARKVRADDVAAVQKAPG